MNSVDTEVLNHIVDLHGKIRILVYQSIAKGLDGKVKFIAQSIRYGQIACGSTHIEALQRVVGHVVAYLRLSFRPTSQRHSDLENWAPNEVLTAFAKAEHSRLNESSGIFSFFEINETPDTVLSELSDIARQIMDLQEEFKNRVIPYWQALVKSGNVPASVTRMAEPSDIVFDCGSIFLIGEYDMGEFKFDLLPEHFDVPVKEMVKEYKQEQKDAARAR